MNHRNSVPKEIIHLIGLPGAGKQFVTDALEAHFASWNPKPMSMGHLFRTRRRADAEFERMYGPVMDDRGLLPNHLVVETIRCEIPRLLKEDHGLYILDGVARQVKQAEALIRTIGQHRLRLIFIDKPADVCVANAIKSRGRGADDRPEVLRTVPARFAQYEVPAMYKMLRFGQDVKMLTVRSRGKIDHLLPLIFQWVTDGKTSMIIGDRSAQAA